MGADMKYIQTDKIVPIVSLLAVGLFYGLTANADAVATKLSKNMEYKLSVRFPENMPVCTASSGGHADGFYAWFGKDCHDQNNLDKSTTGIAVEASYNDNFISLKKYAEEYCGKDMDTDSNIQVLLKELSIKGHRSVTCATRQPDGSIAIYILTQGPKAPRLHDSPGFNWLYINYFAALTTFPKRLKKEFGIFKMIVKSMHID